MKKNVYVIDGNIAKYPMTMSDIYAMFRGRDVREITLTAKHNLGIYEVFPTGHGSHYSKNYIENNPVWDGDKWIESWSEIDASAEEIEERLARQWERIRRERNRFLADSDWTQFVDSPLSAEKKAEFQAYRQELRDITEQPDPFDIWFPEAPDA
jgi:hypothetical protein